MLPISIFQELFQLVELFLARVGQVFIMTASTAEEMNKNCWTVIVTEEMKISALTIEMLGLSVKVREKERE